MSYNTRIVVRFHFIVKIKTGGNRDEW
jgi:hypothetical protein